ncbi:DUF397 domain-containing protein [Streptomyces spectabilis]|uniref:DUF397 domain-containing protein n=1 Tax=Streptomyces spectabilis TaxID=68270 RepID=UPI0033D75BC5
MTIELAPQKNDRELEGALWRTSTYSGTDNNCVEHGELLSGRSAVRDTKDRSCGVLIFGAPAWRAFVRGISGNAA